MAESFSEEQQRSSTNVVQVRERLRFGPGFFVDVNFMATTYTDGRFADTTDVIKRMRLQLVKFSQNWDKE